MKRVSTAVVSTRLLLLLLALALMVPAARVLPELRTNNTIDSFLTEGDPNLAFYHQTSDLFGGDHLIYVAIEAPDVFAPAWLERLDELARGLEQLAGVDEVTGLTTTDAVIDDFGMASVGPLMEDLPTTAEEADRIRAQVHRSPLLRRLSAEDDASTLLVVDMDAEAAADPTRQNQVVDAVRRYLVEAGESPMLAGNPVIAEGIERYNTRDQGLFSALMLTLVGISSLILLRRVGVALLPLAVVLVTVTWTMGLFVAAGHQTNWVTSIITPILVLVGVADAVHFLTRYQEVLPGVATRREAVVETLRTISLPCLFTSLTTAAGFASLMVNRVMPVRVFGTFAAIGVALAFVATIAVLPALLALRGGPPRARSLPPARPWRVLLGVDRLVQRRPGWVLAVSLLVAVPVTLGVFAIDVETNLLKYFQPDDPVVTDHAFIEEHYGGSSPLDIVVSTPAVDGAMEPEVLRAVAELQERLEAGGVVDRGVSLADLVAELNGVMSGDPEGYQVPSTRAAVSQLLLMVDPGTLEPLVNPERSTLRLSTRFQGASMALSEAREVLDGVREDAEATCPDGVEARLTGSSLLFVDMDEYLVTGQIRSFGIVLAVLAVVMVGLFRSLRIGLMAMIPNLMPIAVMLGLMGWLGLPLDGFTVMIASIAIGIGVDDTIHYLHHLRTELAAGADLSVAMTHTTGGVGRALVFTSVVLALGFWVFCLSDFVGTRNFGFLTGVTVLVALVADLLVLPAVLLLAGVPRRWTAGTGGA